MAILSIGPVWDPPRGGSQGSKYDPFWDPFLTTFELFWPFPALNATKIWDPLKRGVPDMAQNDPPGRASQGHYRGICR